MDSSLLQVKKALTEKAATKSLDDLQSEGRKRVRVISARDIAQMISTAVETALSDTDYVAPEEVQRLQEKSRQEFQDLLQARQAEHTEVESLRARVADRDQRIAQLEAQLEAVGAKPAALEEQLQTTQQRLEDAEQQLADSAQQLQAAETRIEELETASRQDATPAPTVAPGGANADMVMALMQEVANLKAGMGNAQPQAGTPQGDGADLAGALDKIAGTLNDRLEQFGKKMGISAAVDAGDVDYSALFKEDGTKDIESNMDNVKVKSKQGGGIAANLARLKKLKGGD